MTEQEAEAMAARLTRIWEVQEVVASQVDAAGFFYFTAHLLGGVDLEIVGEAMPPSSLNMSRPFSNGQHFAALSCEWERIYGASSDSLPEFEEQDQFTIEYLPLFRRNCWLSGCPIEASAHENAEWMQGFSREELQAWNLKM